MFKPTNSQTKLEMKSKLLYLSGIVLLLALFTSSASAQSIGTAPGALDLGELEPGNSYEAFFYVTTRGMDSEFVLQPEYQRAPRSLFQDPSDEQDFNPDTTSQESMEDWIDFDSDTVVVDPNDRNVASLDGGGTVVYNSRIRFEVDVPEEAEPGYHVGAINLDPDLDRSGEGASSVLNLALTQPIFYFDVPGVAERDLKVLDVRAIRSGENDARFDYVVKNNGTVTTWVRSSSSELHDEFGEKLGQVETGGQYIEPGQTKVISTEWSSSAIEGGDYRVTGDINYLTGESFIDETIEISDVVQVESTDDQDQNKESSTWIIVMVLVLLGVLMYSFEIDPVYIIAITGLVGFSALVLSTGMPLYFIGLLILAITLLFIGGSTL